MPRFGFSQELSFSPNESPFQQRSSSQTRRQDAPDVTPVAALGVGWDAAPQLGREEGASVKLSCLSTGGNFIHSLVTINGAPTIETRSLPLPESSANPNEDAFTHARTQLSQRIRNALQRYPPTELLCVDVNGHQASKSPALSLPSRTGDIHSSSSRKQHASLLCLYTKREVFLFEVCFDTSSPKEQRSQNQRFATGRGGSNSSITEGTLRNVTEPFDCIMLPSSTSANIIRIRPAPQRHDGFDVMCPRGSMAMLMLDKQTAEYGLHLYDGRTQAVETPLMFGTEGMEGDANRITDFCFVRSFGLSLLSSLSVLLIEGAREVFLASPILFPETVVPKQSIDTAQQFLTDQLEACPPETPRWRQLRAARIFMSDTFAGDGRSAFVTARARTEASKWPVQAQGPVMTMDEPENHMIKATSIECLRVASTAPDFVGVAIGYDSDIIDIAVLSPSFCIPRFSLETMEDAMELNSTMQQGIMLQRIDWSSSEQQEYATRHDDIMLLPDPVNETDIHYITKSSIRAVSTHVFQRLGTSQSTKATAWSILNVTSADVALSGAAVSSDANFGHSMICQLSNGMCVPANITESRHFNEIESMGASTQATNLLTDDKDPLAVLGDTNPLHVLIKPLSEKVITGLKGMTRIVGTSTPQEDITPQLLAVSADMKKRCDEDIVLPLVEMNQLIRNRRSELTVLHRSQMKQLHTLKVSIQRLNDQAAAIRGRTEKLQQNAASLSLRGTSVAESAVHSQPTITQAEYDYFQELRLLNEKCQQWKEDIATIETRSKVGSGLPFPPIRFQKEDTKSTAMVMKATKVGLTGVEQRLAAAGDSIREYSKMVGMETDDDWVVVKGDDMV